MQPLVTGSAMEAFETKLLGRFAREAQGGHEPNILINIYIYMYMSVEILGNVLGKPKMSPILVSGVIRILQCSQGSRTSA